MLLRYLLIIYLNKVFMKKEKKVINVLTVFVFFFIFHNWLLTNTLKTLVSMTFNEIHTTCNKISGTNL